MCRSGQLQYLIDCLWAEMPEYREQAETLAPDDASQRRLLRSLINVRPPMPLDPKFLEVQDALLSAEDPQSLLLPVDAYFAGRPILILKAGPEKKVRNGTAVSVPQAADGQYRVYGESGAFLALGQVSGGRLTTIKSFFEV